MTPPTTKIAAPREFWIDFKCGDKESCHQISDISMNKLSYPFKNVIHVREVLEGVSDTDRLEWLLDGRTVLWGGSGYFVASPKEIQTPQFKPPREAIDAAMKESK